MTRSRAASLSSVLFLSLAACSGSTTVTTTAGTGAETTTTSATGATSTTTSTETTGGTGGTTTSSTTSGPPEMVTFRYKPEWSGVTAVDVVGGFGLSTDWSATTPLVKLTADATGTWTGSAMLPPAQYPYVFHVTGDSDGPAAPLSRYSVDPGVSAFVPCPMASPTYSKTDPNPCSQVTVPQGAPDTTQAVTGKVLYGGQPIAGYLAVIERDEAMSHHYFANRMDSASDGSFSLPVAPGAYRIQIQYPTFLSKTDADRDPLTLKALRRGISASFMVGTAPVALSAVEMEYLDYGALMPTGTATLPTTFTITVIAGATKARAAVYGTPTGMGKSIGDPWYASAYGTATSVAFDGTFNTKQATETMVKTGEAYFWGTWQELSTGTASSVAWEGESMVFPIKWQ